MAHDESQNSADVPNDSTYINYDDYDDEFVDEAYDTSGNVVGLETSSGYSSGRMYPLKSVALYDFQVHYSLLMPCTCFIYITNENAFHIILNKWVFEINSLEMNSFECQNSSIIELLIYVCLFFCLGLSRF